MNYDPCIYHSFVDRLSASDGALRLTTDEALAWWIAALQREAAQAKSTRQPDNLDSTPKLMVLGMDADDELFTEVVITEDNPENLLEGTWWPIELWQS